MNNMLKKTFGIVKLNVFKQDFLFAANMTKEEIEKAWAGIDGMGEGAKKALEDFREISIPESTSRLFYSGQFSIIILDNFDGSWKSYDILLHECVHAIRWLANNIRANDEEELVAYATGHLFSLCRKLLEGNESEEIEEIKVEAKRKLRKR